MTAKKAPELAFQQHLAEYLIREHRYAVLEQAEITDTDNCIAEDHLWAFVNDTQPETVKKLAADYGSDARGELFAALRDVLRHTPLWLLIRQGLLVRGIEFKLHYPKPRSQASAATENYGKNRITVRPHFYFGDTSEEIDLVLFLNGLPIVTLEVKHEKNQTVHDAVRQYTQRDHARKIFQHPFLYLAADTSDVKAATDPTREDNFRWHNSGLKNVASTSGEYPVEFLYRDVFSRDNLLEALGFFLIHVPAKDADGDKPARPAATIFPRYHQNRMVRALTDDALDVFTRTGTIGRKYLINHSAGSGKTLSICWLADRLNSLYHPQTNAKMIDIVLILTDRKSLDKNIKDDLARFSHLQAKVGMAKESADLACFLAERRPIIATTMQKFVWVQEELLKNPALQQMRVAFLIDEAHRSQDGKMGEAVKVAFRKPEEPDNEPPEAEEEEEVARIVRQYDRNQMYVAFTATPAPATVALFGETFDTYSEAEAIAEDYIVDVARSIISYKTLYNLQCRVLPTPEDEKVYPAGAVAKALNNVAYNDEGLIQYKAEVMLRIFEEKVEPLIDGRAKAMVVASSRVAGLRYYQIIREKLKARGAAYQALYAFSDFVHPETNEAISEYAVNALEPGEMIEDRFAGDNYRIMVVANKFQAGFNQPLLAGMFLDKLVLDRNAVQTISRLNRCYPGKDQVVVVDFTNNAAAILKAFATYRKGTPFPPEEPDKEQCVKLYQDIVAAAIFTQADAAALVALLANGTDAQVQYQVNNLRTRFQAKIADSEERRNFVYLLARFSKSYWFLTGFFAYPRALAKFVAFADYVGPQLIKQGSVSELMQLIRKTEVVKAAVKYQGEVQSSATVKIKTGGGKGSGVPIRKVSVQDMIESIRAKFEITDEEALFIREVTEEKQADTEICSTVRQHREDMPYLDGAYRLQVNGMIQTTYNNHGHVIELADTKYIDPHGGIFDIMATTVIHYHLGTAA